MSELMDDSVKVHVTLDRRRFGPAGRAERGLQVRAMEETCDVGDHTS